MYEALLYEKLDEHWVQCHVCAHHCLIEPSKRGLCGVRENREGTLYALNYGLSISVAVDPIEKKPLYHFLSHSMIYSFATVGCNLRCSWCQNWDISQHPKPMKSIAGDPVTPQQHVDRALENKCPSIAYTYSEPTVFLEYALATMIIAHANKLKNVWVTNGFMTKATLDLIIPYLDAANVDYKGPQNGVYDRYCGGKAEPIIENMRYLQKAGVHLEITTLVIPNVNDKIGQLTEIAETIVRELGVDVPWHVSRFFPAWKMFDHPITPLATLKLAKSIGEKAGIKNIHIGNV
jgi:pyruvate formate lyase activating enzyme